MPKTPGDRVVSGVGEGGGREARREACWVEEVGEGGMILGRRHGRRRNWVAGGRTARSTAPMRSNTEALDSAAVLVSPRAAQRVDFESLHDS